ncbi:MAG: ATP-binding protein [Lachnospiraceae bacterium]|nr:ATP-binding protein [Lachnospiraceae bacterium]
MGIYLNCGNISFQQILNGIYVDKTGLIDFINSTIDTTDKLTSFSRPRRFGKSYAAKMLNAYYDRSCDSRKLFDGLEISKSNSYGQYRNCFDVIYLDITRFISLAKDINHILSDIQVSVVRELREAFPGCIRENEDILPDALVNITQKTGHRFFIIIDEWDALFREAKNDENLQKAYIQFLRGLFKSGPSTDIAIAGAYMTGILPIKKYGTESALTDFREYTMTEPDILAEYVGFTEQEVKTLCNVYDVDFSEMKRWYDGYLLSGCQSVYSPNSVMSAIKRKRFRTYWTNTETYESLKNYISMNLDGLKDAVIAMLGGEKIRINTGRFKNDMSTFKSKDDVLTLLVHLGYLAYDEQRAEVSIPNQEIADEFKNAVEGEDWHEIEEALTDSEALLNATIQGNAAAVAEALSRIHSSHYSILSYNDENFLSCAITIAYFTAQKDYTIIRELPTGKGFADLAFIPAGNTDKPAMIVELKYDKSADTAVRQIKENRYDGALRKYKKDLLLVGINYDKATKKHECMIERFKD